MLLKKTFISSNNLLKNVLLKVFWTIFKNVHFRGPCSLRPCILRPYCNHEVVRKNSKLLGHHFDAEQSYSTFLKIEPKLVCTLTFCVCKLLVLARKCVSPFLKQMQTDDDSSVFNLDLYVSTRPERSFEVG